MEKELVEAAGKDLAARCGELNHEGVVSLDISPEMSGLDYCPACKVVLYPVSDLNLNGYDTRRSDRLYQ